MSCRVFFAAGLILIFSPSVPAIAENAVCPDRPGKGTSACTVPAGHAQVELGFFDESFQRRSGVTTASGNAVAMLAKAGLTDSIDLEAAFALYQFTRLHGSRSTDFYNGAGDLFLRAKYDPLAGDHGRFALVLDPYVKIPTAGTATGNGAIEGGMVLPVSYDLGDGWSFSTSPEADVQRNASGSGMHFNLASVAGLNLALSDGVTLGAEAWSDQDLEPGVSVAQYSLDVDVALLLDKNTQLDGGLNFGLNRATPDLEFYFGISRLF